MVKEKKTNGGKPRTRRQGKPAPKDQTSPQTPERLDDSQHQLTLLLSNLPGVAYRCANEPKWTMHFISEGCLELTGYKADELVNNRVVTYGDLIHPEDRDYVWQEVQQALADDRQFRITYRLITRSGDEKWVWETGRQSSAAGKSPLLMDGFIMDVTAWKLADEKLRQSEMKYSTLVEQSNDGIVIVRDGVIYYANSKILRLIGCSPEAVISQPFADFIAPRKRDFTMEMYRERISGAVTPEYYETAIITSEGREIPVEVSVSVIEYEGQPADMAIIRDITERKGIEGQLMDSQRRYSELFDRMTSGAAVYEAVDDGQDFIFKDFKPRRAAN